MYSQKRRRLGEFSKPLSFALNATHSYRIPSEAVILRRIMTPLGTVHEIWRYPVKSMQGERLEKCAIDPGGLIGDRGWALRDEQAGKTCSAKQHWKLLLCSARYLEEPTETNIPHVEITLPDGSTCRSDQNDTAEKLSNYLERPVTLAPPQPAGNYFDVGPYHLLTTASINALRTLLPESKIDCRRFRPNILIQTPPSTIGFVEFGWTGSAIRLGDITMTAGGPVPRCGMTSSPQPNLPKDPEVIGTLISETDKKLGIYSCTGHSGIIQVGDALCRDS